MPLNVDLTSVGNNTPESKFGIVCTPSWTLNTNKHETTNKVHRRIVSTSFPPIFLPIKKLQVAKEYNEITVKVPENTLSNGNI